MNKRELTAALQRLGIKVVGEKISVASLRKALAAAGAKTFTKKEQEDLIKDLRAKFGSKFKVKPGHEWSPGAVLWSGEEAEMPDGNYAFNYNSWESDPQEKIWQIGVHKDLVKWSDSKGLFWEPNDPGTYLAYPI